MKFIKNWLKKIIKETILENFPSCNITIVDSEKSDIKLSLHGGTFVNSKIKFSKEMLHKFINISQCNISQDEGPFISSSENVIPNNEDNMT